MTDYSIYNNPLITRYASKEMQHAFSDEKRFKLWRKLWTALAEAEMEEIEAFPFPNVDDFDYDELRRQCEEYADYGIVADIETLKNKTRQ